MTPKLIEVRDRMTRVMVLAMRPGAVPPPPVPAGHAWEGLVEEAEAERWFWSACGYGQDYEGQQGYVLVWTLDPECLDMHRGPAYDAYGWTNLRFREFHRWLNTHFDEVRNCGVVDIRVILGEATEPIISDRLRVKA